jgi:transposase
MRKNRKNYTAEEKVSILKEHLVNGVPVSDLCDQHQLHPTVFYRWQRQLFEQGAAAFQNDEKREVAQLKKKIEKLESKVATKNEVLGELMEAHIELKKSLGEE